MPVFKTRHGLTGTIAAATLAAATLIGASPAGAVTTCTQSCYLDARAGTHTGFDRLVFDVGGSELPTVQAGISSTGEYTVGGSGDTKVVQIPGKSYLMLHTFFSHTTYDDGSRSYTTPTILPVALPSLKGVQLLSDFEGYTDFGLSLDNCTSYNVFTLTSPNRIVVDVYH
ncbi:hypothetical protein [Kitasatospora purpeofusca]|uniref:AMIN-like domain-containing (lipo)protein n=1 Tax=Kitasatospora purpeofusca TaxID=67352 RepID=UPI002A59AA73|nr:hypothetical protein [Kitasatospora purpeofusca]MDY0810713.1 hypothetical protein [Kitasatospora purpeofusca]